MPPVLDPKQSKVDGLAFLGLSLARKSEWGHPESVTHQTAFDLNKVLDRDYSFLFSTNDDGWLVGGGEPGPPTTYKLAAKDSAHVEIMRIGTYRKEWGGVPLEEILKVMQSGDILIPQIDVLPTAVVANPDTPPELEIRFDMEPEIPNFDDSNAPLLLPVNWQLRFLHNQLFKKFIFPSRFCPGAFHSTILRKAEFRSPEHRTGYFAKCDAVIAEWKNAGPQPLNAVPRGLDGTPLPPEESVLSPSKQSNSSYTVTKDAEEKKDEEAKTANKGVSASTTFQIGDQVNTAYGSGKVVSLSSANDSVEVELPHGRIFIRLTETVHKVTDSIPIVSSNTKEPLTSSTTNKHTVPDASECHSGIWLFTDRENITHFFKPNFFPPYDTPEKRKIILDTLKEEWDEKTLSWKPCGQGSMTKKKTDSSTILRDIPHLDQLDRLMGNVLSTINDCCTSQAKPTIESKPNEQ